MQENTNKALAINSIVLYIRLGVTMICGLLSSRFALQAIGVNDYGIFSVVGTLLVFINVLNSTMIGTCNRFLTVAIGKGDENNINETFNINLVIHISFALITALIAIPIGTWYISHFVNFDGDLSKVHSIFYLSIVASSFAMVAVPYNGLLMAKERFWVFCSVNIIMAIFKTVMCYMLISHFDDKLITYTWVQVIESIIPLIVFYCYCAKKWPSYTKVKLVKSKERYVDVLNFSVWVGYGAVAQLGKSQSSVLLINAFFNTLMNTGLSIANSIKTAITMFSDNITKPISPQITKNYALGNISRCISLMVFSSKISFLLMFFISLPFLVETEFIIELWLGQVPPYSVMFTYLIVIDALIGTFNLGISEFIFAGGKIKAYQFWVNNIYLISVVFGFIVLVIGLPAYSLLIVYIVFSIIAVIVRQIILHREYGFDNMLLIRGSYLPCIAIAILSVPLMFLRGVLSPLGVLLVAMVYVALMIIFVGFNKNERSRIYNFINVMINNAIHR